MFFPKKISIKLKNGIIEISLICNKIFYISSTWSDSKRLSKDIYSKDIHLIKCKYVFCIIFKNKLRILKFATIYLSVFHQFAFTIIIWGIRTNFLPIQNNFFEWYQVDGFSCTKNFLQSSSISQNEISFHSSSLHFVTWDTMLAKYICSTVEIHWKIIWYKGK